MLEHFNCDFIYVFLFFLVMVFPGIFNNMSSRENHWPVANNRQTLSYKVASSTPCHVRDWNSQFSWWWSLIAHLIANPTNIRPPRPLWFFGGQYTCFECSVVEHYNFVLPYMCVGMIITLYLIDREKRPIVKNSTSDNKTIQVYHSVDTNIIKFLRWLIVPNYCLCTQYSFPVNFVWYGFWYLSDTDVSCHNKISGLWCWNIIPSPIDSYHTDEFRFIRIHWPLIWSF